MSYTDNTTQHLLPTKSLFSLRENKKFIFVTIVFAALCLMVLIGGQRALYLWYALNIACALTIIAYRHPYLTIVLVFLLGQIMGQEAQVLLPESLRQPALGPLKLRYFDPILLGIVCAIGLKLLQRDKKLEQFLLKDYPFWTLFLGWLTIEIVRSLGTYNIINVLGEFRTYYQYMFLIPYIVVFFKTEDEQWRLFKLLMFLSLIFIFIGIIRGSILYSFRFGSYNKWLTSNANLALLMGITALYFGRKYRLVTLRNTVVSFLFMAFIFITLINSVRSVWLATIVAFLVLIFTRQISFKSYIIVGIFGIIVLATVFYVFEIQDKNIFYFIKTRSMAFTDYQKDPTANWRYLLWLESFKQIIQKLFIGKGLGYHFNLYLSRGVRITTSPHNLYISIAYQLGTVGLLLYIGFISQLFLQIRKTLKMQISLRPRVIVLTAFVILLSSSFYYIAYTFEYFTWLYVGLGIAVIMNAFNSKEYT